MLPMVEKRAHFQTIALVIHPVSVPRYVLRKWAGKEGREGRKRKEGRKKKQVTKKQGKKEGWEEERNAGAREGEGQEEEGNPWRNQ